MKNFLLFIFIFYMFYNANIDLKTVGKAYRNSELNKPNYNNLIVVGHNIDYNDKNDPISVSFIYEHKISFFKIDVIGKYDLTAKEKKINKYFFNFKVFNLIKIIRTKSFSFLIDFQSTLLYFEIIIHY